MKNCFYYSKAPDISGIKKIRQGGVPDGNHYRVHSHCFGCAGR